jgi:molybdopterin molybdotransferase
MRPSTPARTDVRLRGFADLATVASAQEWVDRTARQLPALEVATAAAAGRVLATPLTAPADCPGAARASSDGYAVRAADTIGASAYDPVALRTRDPSGPLGPAAAALVFAGAPLPPDADAVLGFDAAQPSGDHVDVFASVAPGAGVHRVGQLLRAGHPLGAAGRVLDARDVALLCDLGVERVSLVGRPRVRLVIAGPKGGGPRDAHGPMLRTLVARDGGEVETVEVGAEVHGALGRALRSPGPELILVTGRTGTGPDDVAPLALAEAGDLTYHGLNLRPGGSAGMGVAGEVPVLLLPGDPLACLVAYELLGGRFVRRLGGRGPALPHPTRELELRRKLVSAVGLLEVCQVRVVDGGVEPLGLADSGGLAVASRADGFVIVPAPFEGYAPGARVLVHTY